MTILARQWVPAAAVMPQECGPEFLGIVDGADWSEGRGFYRGFFTTFTIKAGKTVWFHWPLPTPVTLGGQRIALASASLLWEVMDGAAISWITVQHGGMDRIELTGRMQSPHSVPVPFTPTEEFRPYCPETRRRMSVLPLPEPLALLFGVQLCVMVSAPDAQDGTVRFYGAGADFVAAPG